MPRTTAMSNGPLSAILVFAISSFSPLAQGRNSQSASDTRNSQITQGRPHPRAERPGASVCAIFYVSVGLSAPPRGAVCEVP